MSRGNGTNQQSLLAVLEREGELPLPSLLWRTAEHLGVVDPDGDLAPAIYSNLHRATLGLKRLGAISGRVTTHRRLEDVVVQYSDRTKLGAVRHLRRVLLPHVVTYLGKERLLSEGSRACEDRAVGGLDPKQLGELKEAWANLERALRSSLVRASEEARKMLLMALVRGAELFNREAGVHCDVAFIQLVPALDRFAERRLTVARLLANVVRLLPCAEYERERFKLAIFRVARLDKGKRAQLTTDFKEYLIERAPDIVAALPGHTPAITAARVMSVSRWLAVRSARFSPELDKLIMHDVLKSFTVYKAGGSKGGAPATPKRRASSPAAASP